MDLDLGGISVWTWMGMWDLCMDLDLDLDLCEILDLDQKISKTYRLSCLLTKTLAKPYVFFALVTQKWSFGVEFTYEVVTLRGAF